MRIWFWILLVVFLSSCSANHYAKRSRKNWEKAVRLDPSIVNRDTTWVRKDTVILQPGTVIDTLVDIKTDTVTIVKDNVTVKTVYVPKLHKQYIYVDKAPVRDTVRIEIPIIKEKIVEKFSFPWWTKPVLIVAGILTLVVVGLRLLKKIGVI
jgi:hypothetical protein